MKEVKRRKLSIEKIIISLLYLFIFGFVAYILASVYFPSIFSMELRFGLFMFCLVLFFMRKINKIPQKKRNKSILVYIFSHLFLLSLIIFALNQFLKRAWIIDNLFYLSIVSIGFGFLTFYSYKDNVEKKIDFENDEEENAERRRFKEFGIKFPTLNKIPLLRKFARWLYKEGWIYSFGLIGIILLGFILRIWNLNYLQGADNYNLISSLSYFQDGSFFYLRNSQITLFLGTLFSIFEPSLFFARLPFVLVGTASILLTYLFGKLKQFINMVLP